MGGLDVRLVDGEAHLHARHLGMLGHEPPPHRSDRGTGSHLALGFVPEPLAEHREEPQPDAHRHPRASFTMWPSSGTRSFDIASSTAAVEPGMDATTFPRATPATARESMAAAPICS